MRKRFSVQYELGATPIEKLELPLRSRDELPPVLRGLQYIYSTPELNRRVFALLEEKILSGVQETGRNGMSLWEILVFATVRLALDCNYDRLEHIANYDNLVRLFLGIPDFGNNLKRYSLQSLKDNVRLLDEETLDQINELVVSSGYRLKKNDGLNVKVDSYVFETNVHFPTDLNLLYDAARKCIDLVNHLRRELDLAGWRKYKQWRRRIKSAHRKAAKGAKGFGKNTVLGQQAVLDYLMLAKQLLRKLEETLQMIEPLESDKGRIINKYGELQYYYDHLSKHIDLVHRRLIFKEIIPHDEKVFSLFEPHTEWIKKGKIGVTVELGLRIAIATDQYGFILGHQVMAKMSDVDVAVPFSQRLISGWNIDSISFDKGFWSPDNFKRIEGCVAHLVMPKKGRLNKTEQDRERNKTFKALRRQHSAVESNINCLEHHGLNRCPDKGMVAFSRYTSIGILAYNLHKLGNILLEQDRKKLSKNNEFLKAA